MIASSLESICVLLLLLLVNTVKGAKYPKLPACREEVPEIVEYEEPPGIFGRQVCTESPAVQHSFVLARNEEVFITIAAEISEERSENTLTGTSEFQFRPNDRRLRLRRHTVDDFAFFADGDPTTSEGGLGILVVQSQLLDGNSNALSSTTVTSPSAKLSRRGLWGRGQPSELCAHPVTLQLEEEFQDSANPVCGRLNATWSLHRHSEDWNSASTTFVGAPSILSRDGWCGSINQHTERLLRVTCDNNPKWFVPPLKRGDVLSIKVELLAAFQRAQVDLNLFTGGAGRAVELHQTLASMTFQEPGQAQTFKARFSNNLTADGQDFYVELAQRREHVYSYAIAFRVDAACQDSPKKMKFTLVKEKKCRFLQELLDENKHDRVSDICNSLQSNAEVHCPFSCDSCTSTRCDESENTKFRLWQKEKNCKWLAEKSIETQSKFCRDDDVRQTCPVTCDACE